MTDANKTQIGQYGVYHVASLLCWKGYNATCTSRNTPQVDLIVHDPRTSKAVGVQVKTMCQKHKEDPSKDFYAVVNAIPAQMDEVKNKFSCPFVFVHIPVDVSPVPRCFVVPRNDVFNLCSEQWETYRRESRHRLAIDDIANRPQPLNITVKQLIPYEEEWANLWL